MKVRGSIAVILIATTRAEALLFFTLYMNVWGGSALWSSDCPPQQDGTLAADWIQPTVILTFGGVLEPLASSLPIPPRSRHTFFSPPGLPLSSSHRCEDRPESLSYTCNQKEGRLDTKKPSEGTVLDLGFTPTSTDMKQ